MFCQNVERNPLYQTLVKHPLENDNKELYQEIQTDRFGFWLNLFCAPLALVPVSEKEGSVAKVVRIAMCILAIGVATFAFCQVRKCIKKMEALPARHPHLTERLLDLNSNRSHEEEEIEL